MLCTHLLAHLLCRCRGEMRMTCPSAMPADDEHDDYSQCKVFDKRPEKRRELFGVQLEVSREIFFF